jgi:hypothetical protein
MSNSFIQKNLHWICEHFKKDTSKMLIATGTLGWALSSFAQMFGILGNNKISAEQKSFLLPQELMDAVVNVGAFFTITMLTKKFIARMATTGKIAPQSVRDFINKNSIYKDKVGKLDFKLDDVLPKDSDLFRSYQSHKNFVTTMGTVGASVLSCNIVTPLIRNATASRVQKNYIDMNKNTTYNYSANSGNMKV